MNYANINKTDLANGEGIRVSLFVSGCTHHCEDCFNSNAWDFNYGKLFDEKTKTELINALDNSYIKGVTFLGGDPLEKQNIQTVYNLCKEIKNTYPTKDIWLYTGCVYEDIKSFDIINYIDVLVDGEFKKDKKDLTLKWRGSSNQRVIDVKETLKQHKIILYCD